MISLLHLFQGYRECDGQRDCLQAAQYMAGEQSETSLWDFTRATGFSTVEMKGIADSLKKISSDGKIRKVALVGSKRINIGLGKLFTAFAQLAGMPYTYKVFRDLDHAMQWLGDK
jgi:hydroxylamine reductase (hybrid-cluster protein)